MHSPQIVRTPPPLHASIDGSAGQFSAANVTTDMHHSSSAPNLHFINSTPEDMAILFAENKKAQMSARAMFELVHQYGDNLREGWKNVLDCLLFLLRANLLPPKMIQVEDFVHPHGHVSLKERFKRRPIVHKKEESGLLSWLGFTSSSSASEFAQNKRTGEEQSELCKQAAAIIAECHPELLVADSRYLANSALTELVNSIIHCSLAISPQIPQFHHSHHDHGEAAEQQKEDNNPQQQPDSHDDESIVDLTSASAALLPHSVVDSHCQQHNEYLDQQTVSKRSSPPPSSTLAVADLSPADDSTLVSVAEQLKQQQPQNGQQQMQRAASTLSIGSSISSLEAINHQPQQLKAQRRPPVPTAPAANATVVKLSMDEEEALVFLLELMVSIVLENRDRLGQVWPLVRDHLRWLLAEFPQNQQLFELAVVAIIRIANRNLFRLGQHSQPQNQQQQQSPAAAPPPQQQPQQHSKISTTKSVVIVMEQEKTTTTENLLDLNHTIQGRTVHCADEVLHFMGRQLLALHPPELFLCSRQIAFGLQVLLRANAANIHSKEHWEMFFALLEAIGAAAYQEDDFELVEIPPPVGQQQHFSSPSPNQSPPLASLPPHLPAPSLSNVAPLSSKANKFKRGTIVLAPNLSRHDPAAFLKVVETLAFLARDAAHITPANFTRFTHCLRMMVEASMDGGKYAPMQLPTFSNLHISNRPSSPSSSAAAQTQSTTNTVSNTKQFFHVGSPPPQQQLKAEEEGMEQQQQQPENAENETGKGEAIANAAASGGGVEKISEQEHLANCYMDASLQLLNICSNLHARAANIHNDWSSSSAVNKAVVPVVEEQQQQQYSLPGARCSEVWLGYWRPLLQAMARISCDCRRRIRAHALDTLGAAFRIPALNEMMQPLDWEDCFVEVLFPLLSKLLSSSPPISPMDPLGMEEARIRAIQLTCKILLSNLTQLSRSDSLADILRRLFDLVEQFLSGTACSDLLAEVIQESLKNCILVSENFGIFHGAWESLKGEMDERLEKLAKIHGGALKVAV